MIKTLNKSKPVIDRIDLLLNLAQFHVFKPGESKIDFDSANVYIKEAEALNATVRSQDVSGYLLLTKSYMTREKGQRDEAKQMVEKAISLLETGKNKSYLGKAYYELSQYYNCCTPPVQLDIMIPLVERSVDAFQQAGDLERKAFSLKMLGDLLNIDGKNPGAIDALKRSLDAYDSIHYKKLQGVYGLLGRIYREESDYRQALRYELLALKTAEDDKDSSMQLCEIHNNLGTIYNSLRQYELSVKYYKNALEIAKKHDDGFSVMVIMVGIAAGYNALNQPVKAIEFLESIPKKYLQPRNDEERVLVTLPFFRAYYSAKEFSKAKPYCDILLKLVDSKDISNSSKNSVYRTIAGYYMRMKDYPAARFYMNKNEAINNGMGPFRRSLDLLLLYKLDSAQGSFQSAFKNLLEYKTINDSLLNDTKSKQLQQLEVEYEIAKKQDSIKLKDQDILLLTQKNNLQQANLRQARLTRNVTIALIILSFIIIIQLYRQYRHKQQSSNLISLKNEQLQHFLTEKEWLLKEIHHRVKNNLQTVMSLLNSQSAYIDNDVARTAIHDSQHRVHAMSLIHQKLYGTENVSCIDISVYIRELVSYLRESFNTGHRITFELAIDPVEMDVSQSVPLGLILNEAITNSIKYAFPDDRKGIISISLSTIDHDHFLLTIADNGIGMPAHFNNKRPGSLGMSLMAGLSEDLDGKFTVENNNGTILKISFKHEPGVRRPGRLAASFASSN
jgi:two-component sensor histidine kinase